MALVSVVVAVFNTEDYLGECLESILRQTLDSIEVVCVDDGSVDGSAAILDDYAARDERIRVLHQTNQGVSAARNAGLAAATGDWIMFVDSDDSLAPTACEKALAVADATNADIVVFGGSTFPTDPYFDTLLKPRNAVIDNSLDALLHERGSIPFTWNKLYRRSLLENCNARFDEALDLGEDNAFQFNVFPHASRVAFCQDELYLYRFHRSDSTMRNLWEDMGSKLDLHLDVIESVFESWEQNGLLQTHRNDLANWAIDFLWPDVIRTGYNARCALADRLKVLTARYALSAERLDDAHQARLRFMLDARGGLGSTPKLSLVVFAEPGTADIAEGFARLTCQTEQRLQILCIRANATEEDYRTLLSAAEGDARACIVDALDNDEARIISSDKAKPCAADEQKEVDALAGVETESVDRRVETQAQAAVVENEAGTQGEADAQGEAEAQAAVVREEAGAQAQGEAEAQAAVVENEAGAQGEAGVQIKQELAAALRAVRAPYVMFCSLNDLFEQNLAEEVLWSLSRQAADVCTFFDHFHLLGLGDVGRMLVARETTGVEHQAHSTGTVPPYSAHEAGRRLYEYASLSFRNKVFATDYLHTCSLASLDENSIAQALEQADNILPLGHHFVQIAPLTEATEEDAAASADSLVRSFQTLAQRLREDDQWDANAMAWSQAFASAAFTRSYQYTGCAAAAFADAIRRHFDSLLPEDDYPTVRFTGKAGTFVSDLRQLPADRFIAHQTARRIAYLQHYCHHLEEQREQLTQQRHHLEDRLLIADSPSARFGRALGTPLRIVRKTLRR